MDKKLILTKIKELFFNEENVVEETFADYKLMDGRIFRVENFEPGTEVKEVTEDGLVDVLDGDYVMEDKTILTVKDGKVDMVRKADEIDEMEKPTEEVAVEMSVEEAVEEIADVVEEVATVIEETPMETETEDELVGILKQMVADMQLLKDKIKELETSNVEMGEKFSAFAKQPSEEPTKHKLDFGKVKSKEDKIKFFGK
jgi:hypothetical protein